MSLLETTKLILKKHGISPKRSAGQNFLVDSDVLQRHVGHADIRGGEVVLEVGPGLGNLTEPLLEAAPRVVAVEKDMAMIEVLKERFAGRENLEIIPGDALEVRLPAYDKVVSNIPYSISSPLTLLLLRKPFKKAVVMYQKEFAERMVAMPGSRNYSRISVATAYYASARILETLPPEAFYPRPEVSSALVELVPRKACTATDEELFFTTTRALFAHRRKTVKNALVDSRLVSPEKRGGRRVIEGLLDDVSLEKRVFCLELEEIAEIAKALKGVMS